jgi:4-hydroxyphenylpyruvate dioxygenase
MGPFPHDAPPPAISDHNPMGTDGFEFVEFCHPQPQELDRVFRQMGFSAVAKHRSKEVTLYRQGGINFILNAQPGSFAATFAEQHGPSAPAMAFRVVDAKHAYERALALGAKPAKTTAAQDELDIPAIEGIGGLQIYLVDTG